LLKIKRKEIFIQCVMDEYQETNATIQARHPKLLKDDTYKSKRAAPATMPTSGLEVLEKSRSGTGPSGTVPRKRSFVSWKRKSVSWEETKIRFLETKIRFLGGNENSFPGRKQKFVSIES
jgi:hypothetical protein